VKPYLTARERVVDVGAGTCQVAAALHGLEIDIVPVDVHDLSCVDDLTPTLYDGTYLPFDSASFDVALLVNVLHHVSDPDRMLLEAMRVADRIIIHEDIYRSPTQRRLTELMDSITNMEFIGHPHSNRDDAGWRRTFARLGLTVLDAKYRSFWKVFVNATYHVAKSNEATTID
jgi:SAM-dependent methyltransferase